MIRKWLIIITMSNVIQKQTPRIFSDKILVVRFKSEDFVKLQTKILHQKWALMKILKTEIESLSVKRGRYLELLPETRYLEPVWDLRWIPVNSIFKDQTRGYTLQISRFPDFVSWKLVHIQTLLMVDKLLLGCVGTESKKLLVYIDLGKCMSIIHGLWRPVIEGNPPILDLDYIFFKK